MSSYIKKRLDTIKTHLQNKQYDDVIRKGTELFKDYPEQTTTLNEIIVIFKNMNDTEKTINGLKSLAQYLSSTNIPFQYIPSYCIIYNELATSYFSHNKYKETIDCYQKITSKRNNIPDIYVNQAICHRSLMEYSKAIICLKIALSLEKNDSTYRSLGNIYFYSKMYKDSIKHYESIKNQDYNDLYNTSFPYLAIKKFVKGFKLYENRLASNDIHPQTNNISRVEIPSIPYWDGKVSCNHLMVIYEQGIGDNIQFFRFIIELSNRYPELKITYFCKNIVSHLFNTETYKNITVIDDSSGINISLFDKKIYIMSLPYILTLNTIIPNSINYIVCDSKNDEKWRNKLIPFENKLKVGFMYSGLLISYINKHIDLEYFKPICCDKNIQTICLHKMDSKIKEDFSKIDFANEILVEDLDMEKAFVDTISILRNIDVLVTIDTSIAHLAGVMGIKTLLLLGYTSDWRWFDNDDKVWYDSVDIIRMTEQRPMSDLIPRVKTLLDAEYQKMM
jgi:tetratricopeptide (TPR) repeat protein